MGNTNYFSGIVKILEVPKQRSINSGTLVTTFRAELPYNRKSKIVHLNIWGNLGQEVNKFYKLNDYILIEGYVSIRQKNKLNSSIRNPKQLLLTVLKIYPILLNPNRT